MTQTGLDGTHLHRVKRAGLIELEKGTAMLEGRAFLIEERDQSPATQKGAPDFPVRPSA